MKIALCIITKGDEEIENLKIAVGSAEKYVDEVCITTNSKEYSETIKYCEENGYKHSHLAWNDDFSEQRNFNFSQTSDDVDYIFWLDSDDELVGGEQLPELLKLARSKEYDAIFMSYWYGCEFSREKRTLKTLKKVELYHSRERLLKKSSYSWVGAIHETPVEHKGINLKYTGIVHLPEEPHKMFQIAVLHRDATRENHKRNLERNARNKRILVKQLQKEREANNVDPRTLLYLMKILKESEKRDDLIKCISLGEEYLQKSGWDEERSNCYVMVAHCFTQLREFKRAKEVLMGALDEWPYNKQIFLSLANANFDLGDFRAMKFYMDLSDKVEIDKTTAGNRNLLDMEYKKHLLRLNYYLYGKKNIKKALKAAKEIYKIQSFDENLETVNYLDDLNRYNEAAKNLDRFVRYLGDAKKYDDLQNILKVFPSDFKKLPFYNRLYRTYGKPKVWGKKEICYYASFGADHFEKWDPTNLKQGIGGSETAVIRLAQEWTNLGYKVTVYGSPFKEGMYDGVEYLDYKRFNPKDRFNIFIQWRDAFLANKIVAKKFYVDLHDIYAEERFLDKIDMIDKIFVKSKYHRELAPNIKTKKFKIISNGI